MQLAELPVGANIMFNVTVQKQGLEFPSEVIEVHDNFILTKPVMSKGKVVGLGGENVSVGLTYLRNEKSPMVWKGISCSIVKVRGRILYRVVASGAGFEMNRRETFRLFVGLPAVAQIGRNRRALNVILKDISETGFAFVVENEIQDAEKAPVRLVFKDFDRSYNLMGYIVRIEMVQEDKIVYGCHMSMKNQLISHYINPKQRQMLSMNNNSNARYREKLKAFSNLKEPEYEGEKFDSDLDRKNIGDVERGERRKIFQTKNSGNRR